MNGNTQDEHNLGNHTADGAIVVPSVAYGINSNCQNNLHYLEGQRLLYPAGRVFVSLSVDEGKSTFVPHANGVQSVQLLQLSSNKRYLAAAECMHAVEQQQVSVYSVAAQKREQVLQFTAHTRSSTVVSLSFSGDTKLLVTASGDPDSTVLVWRWQQAKVVVVVHADCQVAHACLSPWDDSLLAVAGPHAVKSCRFDARTGTAKVTNTLLLDSHKPTIITCVVHLVGGLLAVGTSSGRVMVCGAAGLLSVHDISPNATRPDSASGAATSGAAAAGEAGVSLSGTPSGTRSRSNSGAAHTSRSPSAANSPRRARPSALPPWLEAPKEAPTSAQCQFAVQMLVQRGRGFVAAGSQGDVCLFEPAGASGGNKGSVGANAFQLSRRFVFAKVDSASCSSMATGGSSCSSQADSVGVSADGSATGIGGLSMFSSLPPALRVTGLAVSATDEHLAVATAAGRVMILNIPAAVEAQDEGDAESNMASSAGAESPALATDAGCSVQQGSVLSGTDASESAAGLQASWHVVASGFPTSRVVGLDAAQHLPLLLVACEDGWVRVWDWMRRTQLAAHHMAARQPLCCCLQPSGLIAAVGTTDTLLVLWILKGSLSPMAELPVSKCTVACYSHTGGLLAAAGASNTIYVYPAYYGHEGDAGRARGSRAAPHAHTAATAAGHADDGPVLEAVAVLKGHVSSVTDMVFTGDDMRLVSTGAGGAVYVWDLSTGSRLIELEYVDKKCIYCSACFSDPHAAAVVRTLDGRLQHIKEGQLVYDVSGLAPDCCPMAMTGDGRVVLAATGTGSVLSIGWPQHPELLADAQQHQQEQQASDDLLGGAGPLQPARPPHVNKLALQAGAAYKQLSVQVGPPNSQSPRDSSNSSTPRLRPAGAVGCSPAKAAATPAGPHDRQQQQQQQRQPWPGTSSSSVQGGAEAADVSKLQPGWQEYHLHAARITAMKVLHHAGILFTASADGHVFMSSLSLVLDGILIEPPPPVLPASASTKGSGLALGSTLDTAGPLGGAGLHPPLVLVDDGLIMGLQDNIKALQHKASALQREAQYQVLRQTQALRESLASSEATAAALQAQVDQLQADLEQCKQKAVTDQEQILKELEALHLSAAEQLEGLFDARLALEKEKLRHLAAAKDDLELSLKEDMKRRAAAAAKELAEVHHMYKQQLAAEVARAEAAATAAAEADAVWHEVLMQTEEDLEKRAITDSERLATLQRTAEETQVKLRAEVNILSRSNDKLKAEKAADAARVAALQQELKALQQQLVEAGVVADKLRSELGERDGVISDNYVTMQGLRRRVQELETHKFVLSYKNEAVAAELQPKEEQLEMMQFTVNAQDKELLASRSALLAAQRTVAERSAAVALAKQELWEVKRKMTHQSALLDAVAHDIAYVLQQPNERMPGGRTALQQALDKLATKYCTKRGGGPRTSVQVEAEMVAHIAAAEKKANILQRQLDQALADKQHNSRRLMSDNSALLADVNELQRSNKDLTQQLAAAMHQLAQLQQAQRPAGDSPPCHPAPPAGGDVPSKAGPPSGACLTRVGRSQGAHAEGKLASPHEGQYISAALREQWRQLEDLEAALQATTGVVALQAAHIARLQQHVAAEQQAHDRQAAPQSHTRRSGLHEAAANARTPSPLPGSAACSPTSAHKAVGLAAGPGKLPTCASPPARCSSPQGSMAAKRPATSSHHSMMASLKSDLEAWRPK